MKIIRFFAGWSKQCKLFSDKSKLKYDLDIDIDRPSSKKLMVKYQISLVPTFVAIADNGHIIGKLSNPNNVEKYIEWKGTLKR